MNGLDLGREILLILTISLDAFVISFAYGIEKMQIPVSYIVLMNAVCNGLLFASLIFGKVMSALVPQGILKWICFVILMTIGIWKILEGLYRKKKDEKVKRLSLLSAVALSVALSVDGIFIGTTMGSQHANPYFIGISSFLIGCSAMILGGFIGKEVEKNEPKSVEWIAGFILIIVAIVGVL